MKSLKLKIRKYAPENDEISLFFLVFPGVGAVLEQPINRVLRVPYSAPAKINCSGTPDSLLLLPLRNPDF
jgi:hypothetical protein